MWLLKSCLSSNKHVWITLVSWTGFPGMRPVTSRTVRSKELGSSQKESISNLWEGDLFLWSCTELEVGWIDWKLLDNCPTSARCAWSKTNSIFQFVFEWDVWRRSRWHVCFFVKDFSSFHSNNFRNTINWKCFLEEWKHSVGSGGISILSQQQDWCRPNVLGLDVSSMYCAGIVHDVVHSSQSRQDPCDCCPQNQQTGRIQSVSCANFDLQIFIENWWWNEDWMRIQCGKHKTNDCSWIISATLEFPLCSSFCCQTCYPSTVRPMKRWIVGMVSENFLWFSRNRSVIISMYFLWMTKNMNRFLRNFIIGEKVFSWFNIDHIPSFAFPFAWLRKSFASNYNPWFALIFKNLCVIVFRSITSVFDPWEIPTHESVLSLLRDTILTSTSYLPCKYLFATAKTGPIWVFPWIHPLGFHACRLLGECFHDKPLHEILSNLQCLQSWNAIHSQQHSKILHPQKIFTQSVLLWWLLNSFFISLY